MASSQKNLSDVNLGLGVNISRYRFGIVVAEWNEQITEALFSGAYQTLLRAGADRDKIERIEVPGTFELSLASQWMAQRKEIDAVICLGCVIQGETRHFDFICNAVADGITKVALKYDKPVIFGVLTPNSMKQALDRAGGKHGNKGDEAAATAIKMLGIKKTIVS